MMTFQNLRKPHVLAVIEKARAKRAERAEMTAEHGGN
jgi:phage terminase small subunit